MILSGRYWEITVGRTRVRWDDGERPLSVNFDATKTTGREPNKASVMIKNMAPSHRRAMEQADSPQLDIRAGYQEGGLHDTLFVGDVSDVYTSREGPDYITTVQAQDGGQAYRTARISRTHTRGVALATVIRSCADALGVGIGNTSSIAAAAELDAGGSIFPDGVVLDGVAWRELDMICRSASLRWSVQSGVLQLRRARRPAEVRAVRVGPSTGMVGSPTRSSADPRTGVVQIEARSLLIPSVYPGRVVVLESSEISGSYLCKSTRYTGDSVGQDWFVDMVLEDYDE